MAHEKEPYMINAQDTHKEPQGKLGCMGISFNLNHITISISIYTHTHIYNKILYTHIDTDTLWIVHRYDKFHNN